MDTEDEFKIARSQHKNLKHGKIRQTSNIDPNFIQLKLNLAQLGDEKHIELEFL